jgi:hypothetical protein
MSLEIQTPWARSSDTTVRSCGYLTVVNRSASADRLVSASSPISRCVAICGIKVVGGNIAMSVLKDGLRLPGETTIAMRPRGYHLYFIGATQKLKPGDKVPVTLTFENAGEQTLMLDVRAPGPVAKETLVEGVKS